MESTLERSDPTTNSPIKGKICLAVSESGTGTHPISRHGTNLVEEERKANEPYFTGFMNRRYTNDDDGREQEQMDIDDDYERRYMEQVSRWGKDAF